MRIANASRRVRAAGLWAPLTVLCLFAAGCGGYGADDAGNPPPGKMEVVSVTPVALATLAAPSILRNGDFREWWAGAPAPSGFEPPNPAFSRISRVHRGKPGFVARQVWLKDDSGAAISDCFRVELGGLEPNTAYELSVRAAGENASSVTVSIWETAGSGAELLPLEPDFIMLLPSHMTVKDYAKTFRTRDGSRLVVAVRQNSAGSERSIIEWHEFSVRPVERAVE
jgi:hypothetical protein